MSRQDNSRSGMSGRHFKGRGRGIGPPAEKARDFKGTILRLSDYLRPARNRFILVFFLAVASTLFAILGPKILGKAVTKLGEGVLAQYDHMAAINNAIKNNMPTAYIDQLRNQPVPGFDFSYIGMVLLGLIALYLLSSLFSYAMSWLMASVSQETVYNMRNDVKNKLDQLPLKYFDENTHGDILSRVTNDMDNIANTLQQSLT